MKFISSIWNQSSICLHLRITGQLLSLSPTPDYYQAEQTNCRSTSRGREFSLKIVGNLFLLATRHRACILHKILYILVSSQGPEGPGDSQPGGVRCQAPLSSGETPPSSGSHILHHGARDGGTEGLEIVFIILSSETSWPEPCTWIFLPQPDHRSTDGKYLQYLTVFTHEITGTGNTADLWENGSPTRCREDVSELESSKNNNNIPPATSYLQPHLLRIVWESHTNSISRLMIRDWREAGRQPQSPRHWRGICLSNWATLSERGERLDRAERSQSDSVSLYCVPVSPSLLAATLNMSAESSSWCEPLLQLWLFVSLSYRLYQRLHFTSPLLWQSWRSPNTEHWYRGFCFRSSGELSVYKDTTLTSTAFCPASNITLSLTDRISFPLQLYFCYLQHSS